MNFEDKDLPGLFQSADTASVKEQRKFFNGIFWYLTLLIIAALFAFFATDYPNPILKIISTILFLLTLFIMIWLRVSRPDEIWYNGRAVAESVKTRSWRWMLRAEPYKDCESIEIVRKHFVNDLKTILKQNESLIGKLGICASVEDPISNNMIEVRKLNLNDRFNFYRQERITNQALWYSKKSKFNKDRAEKWFWTTVSLHGLAIVLLLYNIFDPNAKLPIEVIAVAASSVLTWLQSKKHNELSSSYSLTAHEIVLIKSEINRIETEEDLSEYIINCENAFSREHTQWFARKNE
jgi:FtsH-binding integral membrane protein